MSKYNLTDIFEQYQIPNPDNPERIATKAPRHKK